MNEQIITVIVAVIVSGFSLTGTIIGAKAGIREASKLTVYRLEELEKKVDKHNNLVERMIKVEKELPRLDTKIMDCHNNMVQQLTDRGKLTDERLGALSQRIGAITPSRGGTHE